jgi:catechol 2,3-dioxygenase-like lactoylglutathione lyase family enzyme
MKRFRDDLRCDDGGKDTKENNTGSDIAQIHRHRHRIAAGLAKRGRKDFDHPKGQTDFGDLAQTEFDHLAAGRSAGTSRAIANPHKRLQNEDVKLDEPSEDKPWGWRHAYTRDPVGHTVEICSPLPNASFDN